MKHSVRFIISLGFCDANVETPPFPPSPLPPLPIFYETRPWLHPEVQGPKLSVKTLGGLGGQARPEQHGPFDFEAIARRRPATASQWNVLPRG